MNISCLSKCHPKLLARYHHCINFYGTYVPEAHHAVSISAVSMYISDLIIIIIIITWPILLTVISIKCEIIPYIVMSGFYFQNIGYHTENQALKIEF